MRIAPFNRNLTRFYSRGLFSVLVPDIRQEIGNLPIAQLVKGRHRTGEDGAIRRKHFSRTLQDEPDQLAGSPPTTGSPSKAGCIPGTPLPSVIWQTAQDSR